MSSARRRSPKHNTIQAHSHTFDLKAYALEHQDIEVDCHGQVKENRARHTNQGSHDDQAALRAQQWYESTDEDLCQVTGVSSVLSGGCAAWRIADTLWALSTTA